MPEVVQIAKQNQTKHVLRTLVLLCCVVLLLCGCGRGRRNQAEATEQSAETTPAASASAAVPTFTPTGAGEAAAQNSASAESRAASTLAPAAAPSATPTITPLPDERLHGAQQLFRYGDYAAARAQLVTLMDDEDAQLRANALFTLAKAYWADSLYGEALETLDLLAGETPGDDDSGEPQGGGANEEAAIIEDVRALQEMALFLRGEVLTGLGRYSEAVNAYQEFGERHPWMTEGVQPKIAAAYLAVGNRAGAIDAYRLAADAALAAGDRVAGALYLESLAQTLAADGRHADAAGAYDEILEEAQNAAYRAQIQYQAGQAWASAGDEEQAIAYWRAATEEDPSSQYAYWALIEIVNNEAPFDMYQRAYIDLQSGAWYPAITAYQTYLEDAPATDERAGLAMLGLGQAYLGVGDYASAISVFNRLLEGYPECECTGQAWLELARAQAESGDGVTARRTYRTFARENGADPLAPEALWRSGLLALNEDNQLEAAADFLSLADTFPDSERTPAALYYLGLGAYRAGLPAQTADLFARLQADYPLYNPGSVGYWLGRAQWASDSEDAARQTWQALAEREPGSYYGVIAAQALADPAARYTGILEQMDELAGPPSTLADDDGSRAFAEAWLADWFADAELAVGENLGELPEAVVESETLRMGRMLLSLGQRADALTVLERLYYQHRDDPATLYALSLEFERLEAYRLSLLAMETLLSDSPATAMEDAPIFLQQHVYPRHFAGLIEDEARAHDLDPLLLFSLVRQESLFEEGARSFAAAQGLAQVIPDTGAWVAEQLNYPNYSNALIYRPHVNVLFGAYYLDWVRNYLNEDLVSALVGYNAGPGNADIWRENPGATDDPFFVETLPVGEPRIYVQKIVSNLYHYTRLYGSQ